MKASIKVTELTHDDLVTIIADAIAIHHGLVFQYNIADHESLPDESKHGSCVEDALADLLLAGKSIFVYDSYSNDEKYGKLPVEYDEVTDSMKYTVTIKDFLKGCAKAFETTSRLLDGGGDCIDAYNIMQTIVFGKVIYD